MMHRLSDFFKERANSSQAQLSFMGVASFLESTIIPIPLEALLIPYYHRHRDSLWRTALVVTVACLLGASAFYGIGMLAMDSWGRSIIELLSSPSGFESLKESLNQHGFWLILAAGISPIPFQIAMLGAGAVDYSYLYFILAATLARGIRYFGLALLVKYYGERALEVWNKNKIKASVIALLLLGCIYGLGRWLESTLMQSP
ncbi:VTT domain-containing protein [Coraliomargarita sp. SDUM461004]|uniref:VTT domain-containing protein n=1 Tax=Thalassobacterium sedimentorum TaxID=3041258 RepID=A0ABU1AM93_9BACT|nr:VTT domain-containing protein [Coraliomargarita sp. SDUM461004]MDQ8194886.1 VTT domain-containing protein [Coraliomargarita sp. SDUM461004]